MKVELDKVNFTKVGERIKAYRLIHGLSVEEIAKQAQVKTSAIVNIEGGKQYRSLNQLWMIVNAIEVSIPWFFFGEGKFNDRSDEDLPETIIRKRGAGIRRSDERLAAETGQYEGDSFEFVLACEGFKHFNNKPFPSLTEIFELFISLGYRKIEQPTINPRKVLGSHNECSTR
jgi:transcriptional regulator with XRE-family HTH domain